MTPIPRPVDALRRVGLRPLLVGAFGCAVALLAGCAAPPPAAVPAPQLPAAWRDAPSGDPGTAPLPSDGAWWTVFADPLLDDVVALAGRRDSRVDEAAARLAQARALVQGAAAQRQPQLGASLGANRQGGPLVNAAGSSGTLLTAGVSASWEADLFGRGAAAVDAAALDARVREAQLRGVRLAVQAEAAQTLLALRVADAERALARQHLQSWQETLRVAEDRLRLGGLSELAVLRLRTEAAGAAAELHALDRQRSQLEHALAVLVGEPASTWVVPDSPWTAHEPPEIPAGLPSALLARRPDLVAAEQALLAAQARAGLARSAWLPSLALTASGGQASGALSQLLQASTRAWGVSALLSLPLLDGGRREAGIAQAQAEAEAAAAQQRGQVLQALREVEDQLAALRLLQGEAQARQAAATAAAQAAQRAQARWQHGLDSQTAWLDARRAELQGQRQLLQLQAARAQATVALIRALGGGWGGVAAAGSARPARVSSAS